MKITGILFALLLCACSNKPMSPSTEPTNNSTTEERTPAATNSGQIIDADYVSTSPLGVTVVIPKYMQLFEKNKNCLLYFCIKDTALIDGIINYGPNLNDGEFNSAPIIVGLDRANNSVNTRIDPTYAREKIVKYKAQDLFIKRGCAGDFCVGDIVVIKEPSKIKSISSYKVDSRESFRISAISLSGKLLLRFPSSGGLHFAVSPDQIVTVDHACSVPVKRRNCR